MLPRVNPFSGVSAGTTKATSGLVVFSNSNNMSFGMNAGTITGSYTVPSVAGLISAVNVSAGTTSGNLSAFTFNNGNGVSFGLNAGTITASIAAQSNQTEGRYAVGNTTGQSSSSTFDARTLSISGAGNVSVGYSGSNLVISGGTAAAAPINFSAGTTSSNLGSVVFSNSNNVSFGLSGSTITASIATSLTNVNVSAGTTSNNLSAVVFSNSNGVSFGLNGSTVTGSIAAQTNQTVGLYGLGNTTQNSSTTLDARSISFNGLGALTVGYSNGSVQLSAPVQTVESQSGGISNLGNTSGTSGIASGGQIRLLFAGGNNVTLSQSVNGASATITVSAFNQSVQTQNCVDVAAGTQTGSSGTVIFSNSNGISFGMSGSATITASYTVPTQSNQTEGFFALGNTTQSSSTTLDARSLSFNGLGGISVGYSNGSIQLSGPQTAAQTAQTVGLYGLGNTTQNSSTTLDARTLSFNGLGGITVGYSNGSIQLSGAQTVAQTNQTVGLYALGNTTQNSSTTLDARSLSFNGLGAATMGYSNGSIQVSVPVQTVESQSIGMGTSTAGGGTAGTSGSASGGQVQFGFYAGSNITLSQSVNGASGSMSIYGPTPGGGSPNFSAGTTSNNLASVVFSNSNGVSFGLNGSTITGSVAAQTNQTVGLYALGNTTQNSSTTLDARTMSVNAIGAASWGYSNGSIQLSIPQTSSLSATGIVSISTNGSTISIGAAANTLYSYAVYPVVNVTNTALLSANTASSGSASFIPMEVDEYVAAGWMMMAASMNFVTMGTSSGRQSATFSYGLYSRGTGANSSTLSAITSGSFGINVTYNNSTISISQPTTSNNTGFATGSTTSAGLNITSGYTGLAMLELPINSTLTPGMYWLGLFARESTSSNSGGFKLSFLGYGDSLSNMAPIGSFSSAFTTGTNVAGPASGVPVGGNWHLGHGVFTSAGQTNLPSTMALSAMSANMSVLPFVKFVSTQ